MLRENHETLFLVWKNLTTSLLHHFPRTLSKQYFLQYPVHFSRQWHFLGLVFKVYSKAAEEVWLNFTSQTQPYPVHYQYHQYKQNELCTTMPLQDITIPVWCSQIMAIFTNWNSVVGGHPSVTPVLELVNISIQDLMLKLTKLDWIAKLTNFNLVMAVQYRGVTETHCISS